MTMRQVSKAEFFAVMNPLDVHPRHIPGAYDSEWRVHSGPLAGKIVGYSKSIADYSNPDILHLSEYFLIN